VSHRADFFSRASPTGPSIMAFLQLDPARDKITFHPLLAT